MALAYPFIGAEMTESAPPPPPPPPPAVVVVVIVPSATPAPGCPLTLLPKSFASDMKDNGFGTRKETLGEEEEVSFGFGKNSKGSGGIDDRGGNDNDDDDDDEEDEKALIVVEETASVDEPND